MHPQLKVESDKIRNGYHILFEYLLSDFERNGEESYLWKNYLHNRHPDYREKNSPAQLVVDYISGMTDNYFVQTLETLFIPDTIKF